MAINKDNSYDKTKYPLCAPWYGEIGSEFTRTFRRNFEGALHAQVDDFASLHDHLVTRTDPGNVPVAGGAAVAHPGAGLAGQAGVTMQAKSTLAFEARKRKSFGLIRLHIEDETIRDDIDANAPGDGPAAWLIVIAAGTAQQTALFDDTQDIEWNGATLFLVGISETTIRDFKGLLLRLNRERPLAERKSNAQIFRKLLNSITFPSDIRVICEGQLQAPTWIHAAGPLNGEPSIPIAEQKLTELWKRRVQNGQIKQVAPTAPKPARGNRVDSNFVQSQAHMMTIQNYSASVQDEQSVEMKRAGISDDNANGLRFSLASTLKALDSERDCWNCHGFGHRFKDADGTIVCPSPVADRPVTAVIRKLEFLNSRKGAADKRKPGGSKFKFVKRKSLQPPKANSAEAEVEIEVDDDGNCFQDGIPCGVLDNDANFVAISEDPVVTETPLPVSDAGLVMSMGMMTAQSTEKKTAGVSKAVEIADDVDVDPGPGDDIPLPKSSCSNLTSAEQTQFDMDKDFYADFSTSSATFASQTKETHSFSNIFPKSLSASASIAVATAIGVVCLATTLARTKAGKSFLISALLGTAAATSSQSGTCTSLMFNANISSFGLSAAKDGVMDTGATTHTSGRKRLFPKKGVEEYLPKIKVQIANGISCKVLLVGMMLCPCEGRVTVSTKKRFKCALGLTKSLLVENFPVTLISPKALFCNHGIRTYFNDNIFFKTPTGLYFDFIETDNLYILPLLEESFLDQLESRKVHTFSAWSIDKTHSRFMYFSLDRIRMSQDDLRGVDLSAIKTKADQLTSHAGQRKHSTKLRTINPYVNFGDGVASDTCQFETSVPFGFVYMLTFLDLATKYLAIYFMRTHTAAEVKHCYNQYMTDYGRFMKQNKVLLWFMDNGGEFGSPKFFATTDFDKWASEYWTRRKFIVPWNPQENPAESANRILLRPIRHALSAANVSTRMWPFAAHQGCIAHNILATTSDTALQSFIAHMSAMSAWEFPAESYLARPMSPYRMVHGHSFNAEHMRTLFCQCEVLIVNPSDEPTKASPRTHVACHLGLDPRRNGFFCYIFAVKRFTTSAYKDTFFGQHESIFPPLSSITGWTKFGNNEATLPTVQQQQAMIEHGDAEHRYSRVLRDDSEPRDDAAQDNARRNLRRPDDGLGPSPHDGQSTHFSHDQCENTACSLPRGHAGQHSNVIPRVVNPGKPSSNLRSAQLAGFTSLPQNYPGYISIFSKSPSGRTPVHFILKADVWRPIVAPNTVREAMAQNEQGWTAAYRKDMAAKMQNKAFGYIEDDGSIPLSRIHKLKWAHKLVWNGNVLEEERARLVGTPYKQVKSRDYKESYSAAPGHCPIKLVGGIICAFKLDDEHCDVVKAFTQNDLDVRMVAHQPEGLEPVIGKNGKPMLLDVFKALEGLKQSSNLHQGNHSNTFTQWKYKGSSWKQSDAEPTVFAFIALGAYIIAIVLIDDVWFGIGTNEESKTAYAAFMKHYGQRWNYKSKGPAKTFNGITITRDRVANTIAFSLPDYVKGIFTRFVPEGHPVRLVPVDSQDTINALTVAANDSERAAMKDKPYLAALASMIWYMCALGVDICYPVMALCQLMHDPSPDAWNVLVNLIAYSYSTRFMSIVLHGKPAKMPSEYDGTKEQLASLVASFHLHGFVDGSWKIPSVAGMLVMMFGGPIDWSTKLIKVICHSSAETEVSAGSMLSKRLVYIRLLSGFLGVQIPAPIPVFIDSTAAIDITGKLGTSKRTAHFLRWQHYLRWMVQHQYVRLIFVGTKKQLADALTKIVDRTCFFIFRDYVLVGPFSPKNNRDPPVNGTGKAMSP